MSHPNKQNKYDVLLNKFLESNNCMDTDETERMERWLNEAACNIRTEFRDGRGNVKQNSTYTDDDEVLLNETNELQAAMCVPLPSDSSDEDCLQNNEEIKKRSRQNYQSEIQSPMTKRTATDKAFSDNVLRLDMISLSSDLRSTVPVQRFNAMSKDVISKPVSVVGTSYFEKNVFDSKKSVHTHTCQSSISNSKTTGKTDIGPKSIALNTSFSLKESTKISKDSFINKDNNLIPSQSITTINADNKTCIWPTGISYQPDFVEIVVTDEEMNVYWDTLKGLF